VQLSAILVIDGQSPSAGALANLAPQIRSLPPRLPLVCAEMLGQSVLDRTVARLRTAGVRKICVVGGSGLRSLRWNPDVQAIVTERPCDRWPAAQQLVQRQCSQGIKTALMIGLGAYVQWNVVQALKCHKEHGRPLTQLEDATGPLDLWIVNSQWFSTAALGCTLPFRYGEFPGLPVPCRMHGYVNRLADARDLRRLVQDAFLSRCEIKPQGREMRPGIWMDEGARAHKSSRLVAPIYLGRSTKVGRFTVIARFSNLEHHCQVGEGTVVDATTVLAHTALGSGLDVSHAIVDGNEFMDLNRNVALRVEDPKLIRDTTPRPWLALVHRDYAAQPMRDKNSLESIYSHHLSRPAGKLMGMLFKSYGTTKG
jgi:hypothetical protein